MVVLQHEHSLSLIDLNPSYPRNEEVYDDEEDLIIEQAFQSPCDRCDQKITYLHRYYYKCNQCDYSLHKLCEQLPTKLEHASHSVHTLTLFLDESQGRCQVCQSINPRKQLCYHCSQCIYNICLHCALDEVQYHTIYHPSHQHPLIPVSRQRQILAECEACGKKHEGVFYECSTCFRSFIHNDCVFMPKRLILKDDISSRFFHTHPLILVYSFPKVDQIAKFHPTCRICDNSFSDDENHWVYKCEKCRYYAHMYCARSRHTAKPSDSVSGGEITSKIYEDDPKVLHLPLPDQTYNIFTDLFSKGSNKKFIIHNSHEHLLILVDSRSEDATTQMNEVKDLCNGCVRPIMGMLFYKCIFGCNFVLHEYCTRLPNELKGYIHHQQHTLTLLSKVPHNIPGLFCCDGCSFRCNGFAYSCVKCNYYIDVWCALLPGHLMHKSHPYHLLSSSHKRVDKDYCRMCLSSFTYPSETSLSCGACNFHLHLGCAFFLPETIRHKYDKHPMTLTYSPVGNHVGDYFCEVCEEELNPNACFYHCHECAQSMHTACAPLMLRPRFKPYIFYDDPVVFFDGANYFDGKNYFRGHIKFGSIHKIEEHPHPLSFLKGTFGDGACIKCSWSLLYTCILKCLRCKFAMHHRCPDGSNK